MFEFAPNHALLDGAAVAAIILALLLVTVKAMNSRLMRSEQPLDSELSVCPRFRLFAAFCAMSALIASVAILRIGLTGTAGEFIFALIIASIAMTAAVYLVLQVFFTKTRVEGDRLITTSPLGRKEISLNNLLYISVNDYFQFELADLHSTVRFCHFVKGKRALIEHIIDHAPASTTKELRAMLEHKFNTA